MHLPAGFDRGDPLARAFDRAEHSVNIGADGLVMTFAYPADSGQDYAIIEEAGGMRSRVVDDGKGLAAHRQHALPRPAGRTDSTRLRFCVVTAALMSPLEPAAAPTLYFFGVTTTRARS